MRPALRSIATRRPYGGLKIGRPCGPSSHGPVTAAPRRVAHSTVAKPEPVGALPRVASGSFALIISAMNGACTDVTYRMPVSGSAPAPVQFDPPAAPGICTVPFVRGDTPGPLAADGGVNSGPYLYWLRIL